MSKDVKIRVKTSIEGGTSDVSREGVPEEQGNLGNKKGLCSQLTPFKPRQETNTAP